MNLLGSFDSILNLSLFLKAVEFLFFKNFADMLFESLLALHKHVAHPVVESAQVGSILFSLVAHQLDLSVQLLGDSSQLLFILFSRCYEILSNFSLLLSCFRSTDDVVVFVRFRKNAVDAQHFEVALAKGLDLLFVNRADSFIRVCLREV